MHMILMNIFMEENPRVTYIEKKLERVTLNFQRVTLTWRHFFLERVGQKFFFIHHKFASVAGSKNVQKNPRVTPIEKKLQRVTYQF